MTGNLFLLPGCAAVSLSAADPRVALLLCEHVSASVDSAKSDRSSRAQTTSLPVQHQPSVDNIDPCSPDSNPCPNLFYCLWSNLLWSKPEPYIERVTTRFDVAARLSRGSFFFFFFFGVYRQFASINVALPPSSGFFSYHVQLHHILFIIPILDKFVHSPHFPVFPSFLSLLFQLFLTLPSYFSSALHIVCTSKTHALLFQ